MKKTWISLDITAVHLTLVTTLGLKENLHSSVFQSEICLDDLFAEA